MIHEYNIAEILKRVKCKLLDIKRSAEHFWYWDLLPIFGKDLPSNAVIAKIYDHYVIMRPYIPVGLELKSSYINEINFLKFPFQYPHLRWAKSIHAYVRLPYATLYNLDITVNGISTSNGIMHIKRDGIFSSYEEANLHAVLSGIADDVLPLEDFNDSKFD